jgi:predicted branched-subunit amino acid permease
MSLLDASLHALNFMLPALFMAIVMVFASRSFKQKRSPALSLTAQLAIHFIACLAVLILGLILTGHDGKMMTYLAMVLVSASLQWALSGAWKK